ncbi:MAG: hypothetical protein ACI80P_001151 [Flavobacteriales bacterium]|jgi:hypothetical protein
MEVEALKTVNYLFPDALVLDTAAKFIIKLPIRTVNQQ